MTTVEERREVARRLREPFDIIGEGRYVALNGTLFGMQLLAGDEGTLRAGIARLADLIDPGELKTACIIEVKIEGEKLYEVADRAVAEYTGIDRDALLALADELERPMRDGGYSKRIARRIREALGVDE